MASGNQTEAMSPPRGEPNMTTYSGRVAALLRSTREEKGLSVKEVAEHCTANGYKLATPTLYHWENGTADMNMNALPYLAKALKVKIRDLIPPK